MVFVVCVVCMVLCFLVFVWFVVVCIIFLVCQCVVFFVLVGCFKFEVIKEIEVFVFVYNFDVKGVVFGNVDYFSIFVKFCQCVFEFVVEEDEEVVFFEEKVYFQFLKMLQKMSVYGKVIIIIGYV